MKTRYYIFLMVFFLVTALKAQDQTQAFRFSQFYPAGTARYTAMGGAFGAVGGDFTAASQNPAGLGLYRGSEFTITPTYLLANVESTYLGEAIMHHTTNLGIGNLGLVTSYDSKRTEGIVGTTFAFGYNMLNNFNSSFLMKGINNHSSLLDNFTWHANNSNTLDPFYEDLAYQTGLMQFDSTATPPYYWHFLEPFEEFEGYGQEQIREVERRGHIGEYVASAAFNFSHKLYLGGTFGLHSVRFSEVIYHKETDKYDLERDFNSFTFGESNTTRGYGYVFKFGMIYKPIHILRIGASFHAPVVYQLTDDKFSTLETTWDPKPGMSDDDYASYGVESKKYTLRTPYRASLSAALLLGKLGLISAEYEYVDYSTSGLDSPGKKFWDENSTISKDFEVAHNLKAGAEFRLNPVYLRAGAQYFMNPFADKRNGSDIWVYSGGIGLRSNQTFFDIAYSLSKSSDLYGLYYHSPEFADGFEKSVNRYSRTNVMITMGYKF